MSDKRSVHDENGAASSGGSSGVALLCDLTRVQLGGELKRLGQPAYRADQTWKWVYTSLAPDFDAMGNLPQALRSELGRRWLFPGLRKVTELTSKDGRTRKALFELHDGETIESVLMRYERRNSVCVSAQVGCAIGCPYCATGRSGYTRNLSPGEIVEQVLFFARSLAERNDRVTHVVFMGMGEPFLNFDNTWRAIETLNDEQGFALGARHITISTAGVVPGIERLSRESLQVGLSVSLHAADDSLRNRLVPLNRSYPLEELLAACRGYVERTKRRITFEYALIDGVNDAPAQGEALAELLKGLLCHVNLIPLNATAGKGLQPSSRERVDAFRRVLEEQHITVTVRLGRGVDIQAGCGQLRSRHSRTKRRQSKMQ